MIAHAGGLPVEEALLPLVSGLGAGLAVLQARLVSRLRRRRTRAG